MSALSRVQRRRQVVKQVAAGALLACAVTACIFDKGDYQGGGRDLQERTPQPVNADADVPPSTPPANPPPNPPPPPPPPPPPSSDGGAG